MLQEDNPGSKQQREEELDGKHSVEVPIPQDKSPDHPLFGGHSVEIPGSDGRLRATLYIDRSGKKLQTFSIRDDPSCEGKLKDEENYSLTRLIVEEFSASGQKLKVIASLGVEGVKFTQLYKNYYSEDGVLFFS